jgi:cell division protein FtsX
MSEREISFNPATYALSHLKHNMLRSITTVATLSLTIAFILLTSSLVFGLINEIEGTDSKKGLLEGRIPGSVTMFEEFDLDQDLSKDAKTALVNFLMITSLFVLLVAFFIMYNTMAIAVHERKREIGVLRSVGYSSRDVMKIFLTEGGMIGLISFITALFLGTPLIVNLAAYLIERGNRGIFFVQPSIPFQLVIMVLVLTMALTLASTYLPTRKVLSAKPVDMIRAG